MLNLELIKDNPDVSGFTCGNRSIDDMIKGSFYSGLLDKCRFLGVRFDDLTVGYCSYYFTDFPLLDEEHESGDREGYVTGMYIRYIAVQKEYQRNGIGNSILKSLCQLALRIKVNVPFRLIVFDALPELQSWYEKMGFEPFDATNGITGLVLMKMDLLDQNAVERYCDEMGGC